MSEEGGWGGEGEGGRGGKVNPLTKETYRRKNIFQIKLNEVLKNCKNLISADVKADKKQQEVKEMIVAVSYTFYKKRLQDFK